MHARLRSIAGGVAIMLALVLGSTVIDTPEARADQSRLVSERSDQRVVGFDHRWRLGGGWDRGWHRDRGWAGNHWSRDGWSRGGWNRDGWERRAYDRPWRRQYWRGSGVTIGLGIGVPAYRYYRPRPYVIDRYVDEYAPVYRVRPRGGHAAWCASRYRSYRAWDNTYQPYNGPRRSCNSPYR